MPVDSADTRRVKNSHYLRDKCVFAFYAEIQDVQPKWQENYFWGKSPVDSRYPPDQNFCQNHSILHCLRDKCIFAFYTNSRWPPKMAGK